MALNSDPNEQFQGTLLIVSPHMDDEALACGGLIAKLSNKERIHIVYVTDGLKSPAPVVPRFDAITSDLGEVRMRESAAAMHILGVPAENLHFLGLPEAELKADTPSLRKLLQEHIRRLEPEFVFIPFQFDRHPDHLAVHQVVVDGKAEGWTKARLVEYFIYYRTRLLPKRDVRKYVRPEHMIEVNIGDVAEIKRAALDCFKSQTTIYYAWQTRPILTPTLLDEECQSSEFFLIRERGLSDESIFTRAGLWIRVTNRLEPFLVRWKYLAGAYLKRLIKHNGRDAGRT